MDLIKSISKNKPLINMNKAIDSCSDVWDLNRKLLTEMLLDEDSEEINIMLKNMSKLLEKSINDTLKMHGIFLNIYKENM